MCIQRFLSFFLMSCQQPLHVIWDFFVEEEESEVFALSETIKPKAGGVSRQIFKRTCRLEIEP